MKKIKLLLVLFPAFLFLFASCTKNVEHNNDVIPDEDIEEEFDNDEENEKIFRFEEVSGGYKIAELLDETKEEIIIPATYKKEPVIELEEELFSYNYTMKKVVIGKNIYSIPKECFFRAEYLEEITFNEGLSFIGDTAFWMCRFETLKMPKTLRTIDQHAFGDCEYLKRVELNDGLMYIGYNAFGDCKLLEEINIPSTVISIGASTFGCCEKLKSDIVLPDSITVIPKEIFFDCYELKNVTIGKNVTMIEQNAFHFCDLTTITLPKTLTSIGCYAFLGCSCTEIIYEGTMAEWSNVSLYASSPKASGLEGKLIKCSDGNIQL